MYFKKISLSIFSYDVGTSLVYFVLLTAASFALLKSINADALSQFSFIVGFLLSLALIKPNHRLPVALFAFGILVFTLAVSNRFFDIYFDSLSYHQDGILNIAQDFSLFDINTQGRYNYLTSNYPKLSWLYGAALYSVSNNIHISKSINFLLCISVFFVALSVLRQANKSVRILFALVFALNPITVSQLFSSYVDGALGAFLTLTALGLYAFSRSILKDCQAIIVIFAGIIGASALKFTGFVFSTIGAIYFLWLYFKKYQPLENIGLNHILPLEKIDSMGIAKHENPIKLLACLSTLALILLFNPYITNILDGKHIFHPVMGTSKISSLISGQTRPEFYKLDSWSKLIISIFSQSTDHGPWSVTPLPPSKIPFAIYPGELASFAAIDVRACGWGPLFGGVLLSALMLVLSNAHAYKGYFSLLIYLLLISIINPESWWARFNPQIYILVGFCLFATSELSNAYRGIAQVLACILIINSMLIFKPMLNYVLTNNIAIETELKKVAQASPKPLVYWKMNKFHFEPIFQRMHLDYEKLPNTPDDHQYQCALIYEENICIKR